MTLRNQRRFIAVLAMMLAPGLFWARSTVAQQRPEDPKAIQNMLLIGQEKVYLSHLPMFQDPEDSKLLPHRYQAIFEVTFDQQDKYVKDHQARRAPKFYT